MITCPTYYPGPIPGILIFGMDKCDNNRMISTQYSILETVLAVRQARHAHVADNCFKFGLIWFWFALV